MPSAGGPRCERAPCRYFWIHPCVIFFFSFLSLNILFLSLCKITEHSFDFTVNPLWPVACGTAGYLLLERYYGIRSTQSWGTSRYPYLTSHISPRDENIGCDVISSSRSTNAIGHRIHIPLLPLIYHWLSSLYQ